MRRHWNTILALALLLAALNAAGPASAFPLTVSGRIMSVDAGGRSFTMQTGLLSDTNFQVSPQTTISQGAQRLEFGELGPGDLVTVEYVRGEGTRVAQIIRVRTKAAESNIIIPQTRDLGGS